MASSLLQTVLVVDDKAGVRDSLAEALRVEGYECECFADSIRALAYLSKAQRPADLLLTDLPTPKAGGIELVRMLKLLRPRLRVIAMSGSYEAPLVLKAFEAGADDYLRKPLQPRDVVSVVGSYLEPDAKRRQREIRTTLRSLAVQRAVGARRSEQLQELLGMLGGKRYETLQHSQRVAAYCRLFGQHRLLPDQALARLERGALLHDIGKIGIPRNVLLKEGSLTDEEWTVMRAHPQIGYRLLSKLPELTDEAQLVYTHHEKFDGSGYPRGLQGQQIPLAARIFAIADAFDAITSQRPYRSARPVEQGRREVARGSGSQFDPQLVDAFLQISASKLSHIRHQYLN